MVKLTMLELSKLWPNRTSHFDAVYWRLHALTGCLFRWLEPEQEVDDNWIDEIVYRLLFEYKLRKDTREHPFVWWWLLKRTIDKKMWLTRIMEERTKEIGVVLNEDEGQWLAVEERKFYRFTTNRLGALLTNGSLENIIRLGQQEGLFTSRTLREQLRKVPTKKLFDWYMVLKTPHRLKVDKCGDDLAKAMWKPKPLTNQALG